MRILYLIPKLNVSSGVAKITSQKANFFIENSENSVAIVTQNKGNEPLFFNLNEEVKLFDIVLEGNAFSFIKAYKTQIKSILSEFKPDVIVIADNGLKALLFCHLIKTKVPVVLEIHCSKFVSENRFDSFLSKLKHNLIVKIRAFGIKSFDNIVMLSEESINEWNIKKATIIPNPVAQNSLLSDISNKKILCVTRNSYEKGLDRIIPISLAIQQKYPDWIFDVFCDDKGFYDINNLISKNKLVNIKIHKPKNEINEAYLSSSIYISTSRFEVFPLVILEAMSFGLPIVAYDCPIGNQSIITNDFGFLIKDGDENEFIDKLEMLISDKELQVKMGKMAKLASEKYDSKTIFKQYNKYLNEVIYKEQK